MMFNQLTLATIAAFAIQSTSAKSIYEIASSNDSFTTLTTAVDAAGLKETFSDAGTFTIFAPTDAAFAALPEGLVAKLVKPMWLPQLTDLLMYHALGSTVMSSALTTDGAMVETLNGEEVTINLDPVRVNKNKVVVPDVEADNGVIHGIDGVLVPTSVTSTIVDIAVANTDFSTLVAAVGAAGLAEVLSGDGPFTLFAPTNDAFNALPEGTVADLLKDENKDKLIDILKYHVVSGNVPSSVGSGDAKTLNGDSVTVKVVESSVMIGDAMVTMPDVIGSNGIIHVIDKVLMPPADDKSSIYGIASSNDSFTTLTTAVDAAGLKETFSDAGAFTIFAPTDAAFAALPEGLVAKLVKPIWLPQLTDLLMYHALGSTVMSSALTTDGAMVETLNGEEVTINLDPVRVNKNKVVVPDVEADNGVIHGIDGVLVPTSVTSSIVDIAVANDDFSTLVAAVGAAGLAEVLSGDGPFTLFAPTNDAFDALPEGTVTDLLKEENKDKLIDILKYHVVSGNLPSSYVPSGDVETLNGDSFLVEVVESSVMIDDAMVTMPDVIGSNGIIHVIDKVLMPPADEVVPPADDTPATMPETTDAADDTADDTADATTEDAAGDADPVTDESSAGASGLAVTAAIVAALVMVVA